MRRALIVILLLCFAPDLTQAQAVVFPPPSGPYLVGSTYRFWIDDSRPEPATADPDDKRGVLVRFWYPASVPPDAIPLPALPFADVQLPVLARIAGRVAAVLERIAALESNAYPDAPVARTDAPLPVVLFSHGYYDMPDLHSLTFEALASHGYVVAATYHGYGSGAVYPDGRTVTYHGTAPQSAVDDQRLVLDQLAVLNADDPDGLFTGRLQADRVALVGYSYGGQVADKLCRTDARCAAVVNMDGSASGSASRSTPGAAMFMAADHDLMAYSFSRWDGPAYSVVYTAFGHSNFMDIALWAGEESIGMGLGDATGLEAVESLNAYLLAFFDTYLKGERSPLLDGSSADFPDVRFQSRNTD